MSESSPSNSGRPPVDPPQQQAPPPPTAPPMMYAQPPQQGGSNWVRKLVGGLLVISLVVNVYLAMIVYMQIARSRDTVYRAGDEEQGVAIIPITGMITDDTAGWVRYCIDRCREKKPKAIVLRVDSGGGSPFACDRIVNMLDGYKAEANVPIVASFGGYAASGGYFVSAGTDHIVAEPMCITGSIGVISQVPLIPGLLDKIGVTALTLTATDSDRKDVANDITRHWNEQDIEVLQARLDTLHDRFIQVVANGRQNLSVEELRPLARGQTFTTAEALDNKLVDAVGFLDDAVAVAVARAGIPKDKQPHVYIIAKPLSLLRQFGLGLSTQRTSALEQIDPATVRSWIDELSTPKVEYRWNGVYR